MSIRIPESAPGQEAAFVAGATGFTGREVVRSLVARGIRAIAHVRPDSPRLEEWRERLRNMGAGVDTTVWEESAMAATLSRLGPAFVFALLGTTRARVRGVRRAGGDPARQSYEAVDYGLTALLIRAAKASGAVRRFVYLSATGTQAGSRSAYYGARWKTEELLRSSGLPFTIARPSFIAGPGREDSRLLERAGIVAADGLLSALAPLGGRKLRERYASMTNTELAGALTRLALDPAAENRILEPDALRKAAVP
ncbi:MAG: NAD(P)H-binding protein [bacterium]